MKNPFEILGIKEDVSEEDMIGELKDRISMLNRLKEDTQRLFHDLFKKGFSYSGKSMQLGELSIENALAEQFACNITPNSKFMSYTELSNICAQVDEQKRRSEVNVPNARFYQNVISSQSQKIMREIERYQMVVEEYIENESSKEAKENLKDLYIKMKYEDVVGRVGMTISSNIPRVSKAEDNKEMFIEELLKNSNYSEAIEAYEKLGTESARNDLVPELYILSRLGDSKQFTIVDQEFKNHVIEEEKKYKSEYLKQSIMNFEGQKVNVPQTQRHNYGWGIILTKPKSIFMGVDVNNSDFQGRISVKHLGVFSAESIFSERKRLKRKYEKIKFEKGEIEIGGEKHTFSLKTHIPKRRIPKNMREYYYKYGSTKQLYNNIYMVEKVDKEGNKSKDIVFSPIGKSEFKKYPKEFFTNIYFSNYTLDIAKQNGGFAGAIVDTSKGPTISTEYNEDEIASCILYQNGSEGKIIDKSGKYKKIRTVQYVDKNDVEDILLNRGRER